VIGISVAQNDAFFSHRIYCGKKISWIVHHLTPLTKLNERITLAQLTGRTIIYLKTWKHDEPGACLCFCYWLKIDLPKNNYRKIEMFKLLFFY